jgi:hypothetical protein
VPGPDISCFSGSYNHRSPSLSTMKHRDLKTNLEAGKNLVADLNAIDLMEMIPVTPFLACQLSWFITMNLYGDADES